MRQPYLPQSYKDQEKMKVRELQYEGKGLIQYINDIQELPFAPVIKPVTMDVTLSMTYGNRPVSSTVERIVGEAVTDDKMRQLAMVLHSMFYDKWSNVYNMYAQQIDLDTYRMLTRETITDDETTKVNGTATSTDETLNKVTGYNSDEFVDNTRDDTKTTDSSSNEGKRDNKRIRETDVRGNSQNRLDDMKKALELLDSKVFSKIIYTDIIETVGSLSL